MLLDIALDRYPHVGDSRPFLRQCQARSESVCIAWHTVSNVYYVAKRQRKDALPFLLDLVDWVQVAPASAAGVRYAASLGMSDFEDALQVAAAAAAGAQLIVTRNIDDYVRSEIRALTPAAALGEWS